MGYQNNDITLLIVTLIIFLSFGGTIIVIRKNFFQDRYADAQALPPIDESQDWSLVRGQELDGHTILEFTRSWVTCDIRDRNVEVRKISCICAYCRVQLA